MSERTLHDPAPELVNICRYSSGKTAVLAFDPLLTRTLSEACGISSRYALIIGINRIYDIMEKIRGIILDFALTLEENGVRGEGMYFDDEEKRRAAAALRDKRIYGEGAEMREIIPGRKYMHFKGREYLVTDIAIHSETEERYVVYRALYGGRQTFVRPYDMFASEVDREKYPDAGQKYRFEEI